MPKREGQVGGALLVMLCSQHWTTQLYGVSVWQVDVFSPALRGYHYPSTEWIDVLNTEAPQYAVDPLQLPQ